MGRLILTAAHCIEFNTEGGMVLGDYHLEEVETHMGNFRVSPIFIEPLSDIAVLAEADNQEFGEDADAFWTFCDSTNGAVLCRERIRARKPFSVRIRNRDGEWVGGTAKKFDEWSHNICVDTSVQIHGGASGGPILTESGELVGIVSNTSEGGLLTGTHPHPFRALPERILRQLL